MYLADYISNNANINLQWRPFHKVGWEIFNENKTGETIHGIFKQ